MENFIYGKALKKGGFQYLGGLKHSTKMILSANKGTLTYCLYLAPSNMAYGNKTICPNDKYCKQFCLNGSGRNLGLQLADDNNNSIINVSRIKKTKLFFENRNLFMQILIHEIKKAQRRAIKENCEFSIRLNGTSDISLLAFKYNGKNILELFPNVQFYDYTKVASRFNLCNIYPNYDLTLSYNGYNWEDCQRVLENGGKVAVVFSSSKMPKTFNGFDVEDGNNDDMRYLNKPQSIIYLHYHKTANDYVYSPKLKRRVFVEPDTPFVIKENDIRCVY